MNRSYEYLAGKLLAVIVTIYLFFDTADTGIFVIRMLVFGCLFALQLLFLTMRMGRGKKWAMLCQVVSFFWAFLAGMEQTFLIAVVIAMELLDEWIKGSLFYETGGVLFLLLGFIYRPSKILLLFSIVFTAFLTLLRCSAQKWEALWQAGMEQKEALAGLQDKLSDMKIYTRTIQETAVMEERNRFAARIHDKLGHNISGSIILLEATKLMLKEKQGEEETVQNNLSLVTENLRRGVEDIRAALRQERPEREQIGIRKIEKALEEFQMVYGRKTRLETEGELEKISAAVWSCIQQNLGEALTNMLKHSDGTEFLLQIHVMNKAVRVVYADNGRCGEKIKPGMGLGAMEERAAALGGTVLFAGGYEGFQITTLFL